MTNAANGQALGTNLGAASELGAAGGALFAGVSNFVGGESAGFTSSSTGDLIGGTESDASMIAGDDTSDSLDNSLDELATEAGVDMQGTQAAIPVLEGIPVADDVGDLGDLPVASHRNTKARRSRSRSLRRMRSRSRSPCRMRAPHRSRMSCREVGISQQ